LGAARGAVQPRRDAGVHSLGELAQHRTSLPDRASHRQYLLEILPDAQVEYIASSRTIGCRYCPGELADCDRKRPPIAKSGGNARATPEDFSRARAC